MKSNSKQKINDFKLTLDEDYKNRPNYIFVNSKEMLELYLFVLEGSVSIDKDNNTQQKISKFGELSEPKLSISNRDWLLNCLEKLPLTINFQNDSCVYEEGKVKKEDIHKEKNMNVMISELKQLPLRHLYSFTSNPVKTSEIKLDHIHDDHVEAIYLGEVCRQACIATLTKAFGSTTEYYIVQEAKKYLKLVTRDEIVLVQTLPIIGKKRKGFGVCFYILYQRNQLCMTGYYLFNYERNVNESCNE